ILDDENVATLDLLAQIHFDADSAAALSNISAIAGHCQEVNRMGNVDVPHQIRQEDHAALEDAHEQKILGSGIVSTDLCSKFGNAYLQDRLIDEDFFEQRIVGVHEAD